jgi:hypothetical protein
VLAPDGLNPPPELGGGVKAVGVPGGSQALSRSELVTISIDGREVRVAASDASRSDSDQGSIDRDAQERDLVNERVEVHVDVDVQWLPASNGKPAALRIDLPGADQRKRTRSRAA